MERGDATYIVSETPVPSSVLPQSIEDGRGWSARVEAEAPVESSAPSRYEPEVPAEDSPSTNAANVEPTSPSRVLPVRLRHRPWHRQQQQRQQQPQQRRLRRRRDRNTESNENIREDRQALTGEQVSNLDTYPGHVALFTLSSFRDRAHAFAIAHQGRNINYRECRVWAKLIVALVVLFPAILSWQQGCKTRVNIWLIVFAVCVLLQIALDKLSSQFIRPWHETAHEVFAYALHLVAYTLFLCWVIIGIFFVFERVDCNTWLYFASVLICIVTVFQVSCIAIVFLVTFCVCFARRPYATSRALLNIVRNRHPKAVPRRSLRTLRRAKYRSADELFADADRTCCVCLEPYQEGENLILLPCAETVPHIFHQTCLEMWLSRSSECPLCKKSLAR